MDEYRFRHVMLWMDGQRCKRVVTAGSAARWAKVDAIAARYRKL